MAFGSLVRDQKSDLKELGLRKVGSSMEYEFAFPYRNDDAGDSLWEPGRAYQIAFLVGPGEEFQGVSRDTWMSDQIYIRLGSPSRQSIYQSPEPAGGGAIDYRKHSHGAENGQKGKGK